MTPRVLLAVSALLATMTSVAAQPIEVRAQLTAVRKPVLAAEIAGRVTSLGFRTGETFGQGALLLAFDCRPYQARLARARAGRDRAGRQAAALANLDRSGATSRLEAGLAMAEAAAAEAEMQLAQVAVDRCEIRAPFAGRVVETRAQANEYVAEGQPVLEIVDHAELEVEALLPSPVVAWLRPGSALEIELHEVPGVLSARVARIAPQIDPVSQTVRVVARLDPRPAGGPELLSGMGGIVRLSPPASLAAR